MIPEVASFSSTEISSFHHILPLEQSKATRTNLVNMLDPKLLDLPPEIFTQILLHLTSAECVSLSRTCKTLQPFAETRLYDSIDTGPTVGYPYPIPIGVIEDRAAGNCDSWGEDWDYLRELEVLLNQAKTDFHLRVIFTFASCSLLCRQILRESPWFDI